MYAVYVWNGNIPDEGMEQGVMLQRIESNNLEVLGN